MYGTFGSTQSVEVVMADHSYELPFVIELECTAPSFSECPASLSGPGEPPLAPEFEVAEIRIDGETLRDIPYVVFRDVVGPKIAEEMIERAITEAIESGEF